MIKPRKLVPDKVIPPPPTMTDSQLRGILRVLGWRPKQLAQGLGVDDSTVRPLITGGRTIRPPMVLAILKLYADYSVPDPCPHCFGPRIPLRSHNEKICSDCKTVTPWTLSPGQQPLLGNNRQGRTK